MPAAAALDEEVGLLQVSRIARGPGELGQRGLDLRVSAESGVGRVAELRADVVGDGDGETDQLVLAVGAQPGDAGLDQVPEAVELMAPLEVRVPGRLAGAAEGGVQVAVLLLGGGDPLDESVQAGLERVVAGAADLPGHPLEQLVDLSLIHI